MKAFLITVILLIPLTGCDAQQNSAPTPIPEQKLPLPEFLGLYAVDQGKTIPLKVIEHFTAPDLTASAEFVFYDQAAGDKTAKAMLSPVLLDPALSMSSKGLQWDEQYNERVPGAPKGFRSYGGGSRIELLRKPVANHPDMIRLIPAIRPDPGFHMLTLGTETFGVWVDRAKFDEQVAKTTADVKAALSDPLMSKRQVAFAVINDLGTLRSVIADIARANKLPNGTPVTRELVVRKLAGWSSNPLIDPLGNEYGDFVVGRFPSVAPATKQALAPLGDWKEFEVLLTHARSDKARRASFHGHHLACEHCKQAFSLREDLKFDVEKSKILPLTYYISTVECPLCHRVTSAEWGYLHGL